MKAWDKSEECKSASLGFPLLIQRLVRLVTWYSTSCLKLVDTVPLGGLSWWWRIDGYIYVHHLDIKDMKIKQLVNSTGFSFFSVIGLFYIEKLTIWTDLLSQIGVLTFLWQCTFFIVYFKSSEIRIGRRYCSKTLESIHLHYNVCHCHLWWFYVCGC